MKPFRASRRTSSLPPCRTNGGRKGRQAFCQEEGPNAGGVGHEASTKSRSKEGYTRKVKGQDTWNPMAQNSITALDNMLSLSIMSVLTMKQKDKEQSQKHLNNLKDRFISICTQLKVPSQKHDAILQGSHLHQVEAKRATLGKQRLEVIEFLQLTEQGILHLPTLPLRNGQECPLQEQIVGMVTGPDVAGYLVQTLKSSLELEGMRAFLEKSHRQADGLLWNTGLPNLVK
ncbi:centromere protein Q isoform X4 [Brienomyrus brachyistius]|uniref:centromere protein Q isoform X4 n=1 Tax=Brienomyrus brachyistius TaxID=42636 RepID=UPI0020B36E3C|nr:centromere protein Q isoform X4 [Brienomyrus brachyistius]